MIEALKLFAAAVGTILMPYALYIHKRINDMQKQLDRKTSVKDVAELVDLKLKPLEVLQRESADDIKEVKATLEKIRDHMLDSK